MEFVSMTIHGFGWTSINACWHSFLQTEIVGIEPRFSQTCVLALSSLLYQGNFGCFRLTPCMWYINRRVIIMPTKFMLLSIHLGITKNKTRRKDGTTFSQIRLIGTGLTTKNNSIGSNWNKSVLLMQKLNLLKLKKIPLAVKILAGLQLET
jgi:hypothetical protein